MSKAGEKKRLKNLMPPWKPGESGNPEGKIKGTRSFKCIVEKIMALKSPEKIKNLQEIKDILGDTANLTNDEALAVRMLAKALSNPDSKSAERILNHGYGMPTQAIEQKHSGEMAIRNWSVELVKPHESK